MQDKIASHYEEKIQNLLLDLFASEPVKIFLFGSRAKGDNKFNADFDIGVWRKDGQELDFNKLLETKSRLDNEVAIKVDLVDFATKDEVFRKEALKNIIVWQDAAELRNETVHAYGMSYGEKAYKFIKENISIFRDLKAVLEKS